MNNCRRRTTVFARLLLTVCAGLNVSASAAEDAAQLNPAPADPPIQLRVDERLSIPPAPLMMAPAPATTAPMNEALFPRYAVQKPVVAFWTRVFGEYSELQSAIHFTDYPHKVVRVLDFRDEAMVQSAVQLAGTRQKAERSAKAAVDDLLRSVHGKRHAPETLDAAERQIYDLFADVRGDNRFLDAVGTVRAQRGLRERTEKALQVSKTYLPEMERVFASYGLPKQLTRLPLVESSFNIEAYSKVGAAGLWQFIPSSARIYMRLNDVVDDRRDPWISTDAAARHLRDDYKLLGSWPLALTAYNHGRSGVAAGLREVGGDSLPDLLARYNSRRFGFASKNFYAEFLAASDVEREYRRKHGAPKAHEVLAFDTVETRHYVSYDTLRQISGMDDAAFRRLNPGYRPEVLDGKLYVPPQHAIRLAKGRAQAFEAAYRALGAGRLHQSQRRHYQSYKVRSGDTLSGIAKRHGLSLAQLRGANGLKKKSTLRKGQVIKIPARDEPASKKPAATAKKKPVTQPVVAVAAATVPQAAAPEAPSAEAAVVEAAEAVVAQAAFILHKVRRGQTLYAIARRYRTTVASLQAANGLGDGHHLSVGMKIKVPSKS